MDRRNKDALRIMGQTCQYLREYMGLTRAHVADKTGYTTQTIYDFERGRNNNAVLLFWYMCNFPSLMTFLKGSITNENK